MTILNPNAAGYTPPGPTTGPVGPDGLAGPGATPAQAAGHVTGAQTAGGNIPGNPLDNHKALVSLGVLVALAFAASGVAGHSPAAGGVVVAVLVAVTFLLTMNLGLFGSSSTMAHTIESYPWLP